MPAQTYDPFRVDEAHTRALQQVLQTVEQAPSPKVVVFDLDSTLFDNRPRQVQILREYGLRAGVPELFRLEREHFVDWDLLSPLVRMGLDPARAEQIHGPMKAYWRETFFTSPYCTYDVAFPFAPEFVGRVHASGAHVVYLTGRHEEMRVGSTESLRRFGFPLPGTERATLLMKPRIEIPDTDYKKSAFAAVRRIGKVLAAFDNEPAHANALKAEFTDALVVWLRTDRSPANDEPRADLLPVWGYAGL